MAIERQLRIIKLQWTKMLEHIFYVLTKRKENDLLIHITCLKQCVKTVLAIKAQVKVMKRGNAEVREEEKTCMHSGQI